MTENSNPEKRPAPLRTEAGQHLDFVLEKAQAGGGCHQLREPLGHRGSPMSDPSLPRVGFFPFKDRGFETFIRRDLIVRVCFLATVAFLCLVKTRTSHQQQ